MAKGNQSRRGAVAKKNQPPKMGSGGKHRRALEGRGPTPKAEDRTWHPAYKQKVAKDRPAEREAARAKSMSASAVKGAVIATVPARRAPRACGPLGPSRLAGSVALAI